MFKLFLALNILLLNLYACKGGFEACKLKVQDSSAIQKNTLQIPILKNKKLIFSRKEPRQKVLKYDKFLCLYLVEDKKSFKYPFTINNHLSLGTASVTSKIAIEGKIKKRQIGINTLANFSEVVNTPALLTNSCCSLEGLVTPRGIIEKEYIQNFLNKKDNIYSDIGVRVHDDKKLVLVTSIDPFMKNQKFKKDDCILKFDNKKIRNSAKFMKKVLFSKLNTNHTVEIKRGSKIIILNVLSKKRYGGAYVSDTFLEQKGIYFNEDLKIIKINSAYNKYGLKLGDKLLQVNASVVKNYTQIRFYISNYDEVASLLFQRDGFQFFVSIK